MIRPGGHAFLFFLLFSLIALITPERGYAQYRQYGYSAEKVFNLSGDISLIYERDWGSHSETTNRFTHSYNLNLSGFVVDPRIITFQVAGSFAQTLPDPGDTVNFYGFSTNVQLLNERPRRGILRFFPQPIELRYSYAKGEDTEAQNYGISMEYSLAPFRKKPVQQRGVNTSNTGNNGNGGQAKTGGYIFAAPTFFLDYDRYVYSFGNRESTTDHLSLRAESRTARWDLSAEYDYYKYGNGLDTKRQYLDIHADYHRYNKEKVTNFDVYNRLLLEDFKGEQAMTLTNRTVWVKRLGQDYRDTLILNGGGRFFTGDRGDEYFLDFSSSYSKRFSEQFFNSSSLGLGYGELNNRERHAESVENRATYRLTRFLTVTNGVKAGLTNEGPFYGFSVGLLTGTRRMSASTYYEIEFDDVSDGKTTRQRISLDVSGNLWTNANFFSQNYYQITDAQGIISPFEEKTLSLRAEVTTRISRYNIAFGASHVNTKTTDGQEIDTAITTYYATVTTFLSRRLSLNLYAYYQQEKDGPDTLYVTPNIQWFYRKVTFTADYTLRMRKNGDSVTDHRLYLRLTRRIDSRLKPFW